MNTIELPGISGANPLGFLATLGLLRVIERSNKSARVFFRSDGSYSAALMTPVDDVARLISEDASDRTDESEWMLEYEKAEKKGTKTVADLKAPPEVFVQYAAQKIEQWISGRPLGAEYAAAFATAVAVDGKGNTKPTAFHFTAANQQFLKAVRAIRQMIDYEWAAEALRQSAERSGENLRWDPAAERNWALMAENPNSEGTRVNAPLEWLAFRGLPLLPSYPVGPRIVTTGVSGRGEEMMWSWPLWSVPASLGTVRSILSVDWSNRRERKLRGIDYVCRAPIRRTAQGFGNFGPASVQC